MTDAKKRADEIIKSVLVESDYAYADDFLLDGEWYATIWDCDTMDHLRDAIQAELEKQPRWTPIEEAGEWDGGTGTVCRAVNGNESILFWDAPRPIEEFRSIARNGMHRKDVRFYVYPAPPPFNPEEVKP